MFPAALFTTAERQKQPKRLLTGEQINKRWSIQTTEHSAFRQEEVLTRATMWMNLEGIGLHKISQTYVGFYEEMQFLIAA